MFIKRVGKNQFDVFVGLGWENWTRFEYNKRSLMLVKGRPLSRRDYDAAKSQIETMI